VRSAFLGFGSEEALRHIADGLVDGVFTTDAAGRITYWNGAAERITGHRRADAIGADCSLLAGDAAHGCACGLGPIRCGLASSGRSSKRCTIRTKDGGLLTIVKSAVPIRNATGEPVGALESFTAVRDAADAAAPEGGGLFGLVGRHPVMLELYRIIRLVAPSSATVLIVGESGTGKDRVAEAIHHAGPRGGRALVRVASASLDAVLRAGAVATPSLEDARGGTLLLDEVSDLTSGAQLGLLDLLEQREARRAARADGVPDDFRLLCTTHHDLRCLVDEGRFRADLFFRLNGFPVHVPALREHLEDVPLIAERFLARVAPGASLGPDALQALRERPWPGNVRELQNVLEFAALRSPRGRIGAAFVRDPPSAAAERAGEERAGIAEALARSGGRRAVAARTLGISRVTLWKRMKRHGL
jgi:PAS domain S-box-containing protein